MTLVLGPFFSYKPYRYSAFPSYGQILVNLYLINSSGLTLVVSEVLCHLIGGSYTVYTLLHMLSSFRLSTGNEFEHVSI